MTLLRFPEGHVAAVRSLAAGRASSVSNRERISHVVRRLSIEANAAEVSNYSTIEQFGRRAASNGSGTDHGTAAAHLVIGSPVRGGRTVSRRISPHSTGPGISVTPSTIARTTPPSSTNGSKSATTTSSADRSKPWDW